MVFATLERNEWRRRVEEERAEKEAAQETARAEKEAAERRIRELEKRLEDYERRNGS